MGPISGHSASWTATARLPTIARSRRRCCGSTVELRAPPTGSVGLLQPAQAAAAAGGAARMTIDAGNAATASHRTDRSKVHLAGGTPLIGANQQGVAEKPAGWPAAGPFFGRETIRAASQPGSPRGSPGTPPACAGSASSGDRRARAFRAATAKRRGAAGLRSARAPSFASGQSSSPRRPWSRQAFAEGSKTSGFR
jgi:hypothetical protein